MKKDFRLKILGVDPGSRITGFGIIEVVGARCTHIISGSIKLKEDSFAIRSKQLFSTLSALIIQYQPTVVALETVFVHRNIAAALKLGQARGAVFAAVGMQDLMVFEYAPRQVKQAVAGFGGAEKNQVQHMVSVLLNLTARPQVDAADALALALCHASSLSAIPALQHVVNNRKKSWRDLKIHTTDKTHL